MQIKRFVEAQSPEIIVTGSEYPPPPAKAMLAKVVMFAQVSFVIAVAFGDKVCAAMGQPVPQMLADMQQSKWLYSLGAFFLGSQIQSALLQTGAFEIYINDDLKFSKL